MGWLAGQILIFRGGLTAGTTVIITSIIAGIIFFSRFWKAGGQEKNPGRFGRILPPLLAGIAVFFAVFGIAVVKEAPKAGLVLFIFAGLSLFLAKPADEKFFDFFEIPGKAPDFCKWEPWFVALLAVVSAIIRMYDAGNIPQVGFGNEGLIMANSAMLSTKGAAYLPHIGGGTSWPTFTYYLGIIFIKLLGWDISSFRLSSALLGTISVIALYFLARRLTSPVSAAIVSVMYTAFIVHITSSRLYISPVTILYLPHVICLGLLLAAVKNPKWYLYLAAGLACGFSLQGYFPGRGVLLLFAGWFFLMFITRKKLFHKPVNFFIFWAGFVLTALPVIVFAMMHPEDYWGYVDSVNPNRTKGVFAYARHILEQVPSFAGMFFTKSAWDVVWHYPYKPILEPAAGAMFAAGFFMCVFAFWKPVPAVLLILFCGGMIPGMLGGGSSINPNSVRTVLAFPVVFVFCAYAFERVRRVYSCFGNRLIYAAIILAGAGISLWTFYSGIQTYSKLAGSPMLMINENHHLYLMGKEIKKNPKADITGTPFFINSDAAMVFLPLDRKFNVKKYLDSMFILSREKDQLILLDPFDSGAVPLFKKYFPNAKTMLYAETEKGRKHEFYTDTALTQPASVKKQTDNFVPFVYMASVLIPAGDIEDFQSMLYVRGVSGGFTRARVFKNSGFGEKFAGNKTLMRGALLIKENDIVSNKEPPVVFSMGWKGFSLKIDNKNVRFGVPAAFDSGVHFFELSGTVPGDAKGDLPFEAMQEKTSLAAEGCITAMNEPCGARILQIPGPNNWDKPYSYSHRLMLFAYDMYDGLTMQLPFSMKTVAMMRVPVTGEYEITGNGNNRFRIIVAGKTVYENMNDWMKPVKSVVTLEKGRPVKVEVMQLVEGVPQKTRALTVYVKGPGMAEPELAPYDWFYPEY